MVPFVRWVERISEFRKWYVVRMECRTLLYRVVFRSLSVGDRFRTRLFSECSYNHSKMLTLDTDSDGNRWFP